MEILDERETVVYLSMFICWLYVEESKVCGCVLEEVKKGEDDEYEDEKGDERKVDGWRRKEEKKKRKEKKRKERPNIRVRTRLTPHPTPGFPTPEEGSQKQTANHSQCQPTCPTGSISLLYLPCGISDSDLTDSSTRVLKTIPFLPLSGLLFMFIVRLICMFSLLHRVSG